jgi:hypothetical protein
LGIAFEEAERDIAVLEALGEGKASHAAANKDDFVILHVRNGYVYAGFATQQKKSSIDINNRGMSAVLNGSEVVPKDLSRYKEWQIAQVPCLKTQMQLCLAYGIREGIWWFLAWPFQPTPRSKSVPKMPYHPLLSAIWLTTVVAGQINLDCNYLRANQMSSSFKTNNLICWF